MNQPTPLLGADTDELRRLRQQMEAFVSQLQSVGATTTQHLQSLAWHGRDQQTFLDAWNGQYQPSLSAPPRRSPRRGGSWRSRRPTRTASAEEPAAAVRVPVRRRGRAAASERRRWSGAVGAGRPWAGATTPATSDDDLGSLSRRYESNGNPGTVSTGRGDHGGVSYGTYQLSSRTGSASEFVTWLRREHPEYADQLGDARPGTAAFSQAWRETAAANPTEFGQIQHDYIQYSHYEPQRRRGRASAAGDQPRGPRPGRAGRALVDRGAAPRRDRRHLHRAVAGRDVSTMTRRRPGRGPSTPSAVGATGRPTSRARRRRSGAGVVNRFGNEQADALARLGQ